MEAAAGSVPAAGEESLGEFVQRLRLVFDAVAEEPGGSLPLRRFIQTGLRFVEGEELQRVAEQLDPQELGHISFPEFCRGIFTIKGCAELLDKGLCVDGSLARGSQASGEEHCGPQVRVQRSQEGQLYPADVTMTLRQPDTDMESDFQNLPSVAEASGTPPPTGTHLLPSPACAAVQPRLHVDCAQCRRSIDILNLQSRLRTAQAHSSSTKLSSTAFGRQLFHSSTLGSCSTEDLTRDSDDSPRPDIAQKVCYLERKVTELEMERLMKGEQKSKLMHQNIHLVHRVHAAEELVRDEQGRAHETMRETRWRHRQLLGRVRGETETQTQSLRYRAQQLDEESQRLKLTAARIKCRSERLGQEHQCISYQWEDAGLRLQDELQLHRRMVERMRQSRLQFQREREAMQELVEDLRRELLVQSRCGGRGVLTPWGAPCTRLCDLTFPPRPLELQYQVERLTQDNERLQEQNDGLNGQVLALSLSGAAELCGGHARAQNLATEIDTASQDQLLGALRDQEEVSERLREYMERIILAIIDHSPSILEIKK